MSASNKIIQAVAGNAAGEATYVEDVFSTYLYTGNFSTQTITNGIDLDGEGGLVWIKNRSYSYQHHLVDTERGPTKKLATNSTSNEITQTNNVDSFNSDGFSINFRDEVNSNGRTYASWTFRKAPKFFDVVTWTGDGDSSREIQHNLGSIPGAIFCKRLDTTSNWAGYHIGNSITSGILGLSLNVSNAPYFTGINNSSRFNDTMFQPYQLYDYTTANRSNENGATYVAYLFAHNDGDGIFGENGDQDIIKCGSYTGNGSTDGPEIDLGFEPQWLLAKNAEGTGDWLLFDTMRGWPVTNDNQRLRPNSTAAEDTRDYYSPTSTGFKVTAATTTVNGSGTNYIYIAIRRGPMKTPESGTEVFAVDSGGNGDSPAFISNFPVDLGIRHPDRDQAGNGFYWSDRIRGNKYIKSDSTAAETTITAGFDQMDGFEDYSALSDAVGWMFRRAPGFFDVVAYTGTGASQSIGHNLGVVPELFIVKQRTGSARPWVVYSQSIGNTGGVYLNATNAEITSSTFWNNTTPTSSSFTVGSNASTGASGEDYIAYLFATLPGVSKVGSYSGNASGTGTQTIDCGFSNGARFVLIKCTSATGNWVLFDTERGITSGLDNFLLLNATDAETTNADLDVDPDGTGFILDGDHTAINRLGRDYIFLAIA